MAPLRLERFCCEGIANKAVARQVSFTMVTDGLTKTQVSRLREEWWHAWKTCRGELMAETITLEARVASIETKVDMILGIVRGDSKRAADCRKHCDLEMPKVHKRIDNHISEYHRFNPVWLVAAGSWVGTLLLYVTR